MRSNLKFHKGFHCPWCPCFPVEVTSSHWTHHRTGHFCSFRQVDSSSGRNRQKTPHWSNNLGWHKSADNFQQQLSSIYISYEDSCEDSSVWANWCIPLLSSFFKSLKVKTKKPNMTSNLWRTSEKRHAPILHLPFFLRAWSRSFLLRKQHLKTKLLTLAASYMVPHLTLLDGFGTENSPILRSKHGFLNPIPIAVLIIIPLEKWEKNPSSLLETFGSSDDFFNILLYPFIICVFPPGPKKKHHGFGMLLAFDSTVLFVRIPGTHSMLGNNPSWRIKLWNHHHWHIGHGTNAHATWIWRPNVNGAHVFSNTLPETNSKSPWKWMVGSWNTTFLLGRPIFRGYVSFREGTCQVTPPEKNWRREPKTKTLAFWVNVSSFPRELFSGSMLIFCTVYLFFGGVPALVSVFSPAVGQSVAVVCVFFVDSNFHDMMRFIWKTFFELFQLH